MRRQRGGKHVGPAFILLKFLDSHVVSPSWRLLSTDPVTSEEIHCESLQTRLGQSTTSAKTVSTHARIDACQLRQNGGGDQNDIGNQNDIGDQNDIGEQNDGGDQNDIRDQNDGGDQNDIGDPNAVLLPLVHVAVAAPASIRMALREAEEALRHQSDLPQPQFFCFFL